MKKIYENPTLEVITLIEEDVMTASKISWFADGDGEVIDFGDLF